MIKDIGCWMKRHFFYRYYLLAIASYLFAFWILFLIACLSSPACSSQPAQPCLPRLTCLPACIILTLNYCNDWADTSTNISLLYLCTQITDYWKIVSLIKNLLQIVRQSDSDQVTVIGACVTLHEALKAANELASAGINIRVIDLFTIKPLDVDTILSSARETGGRLVVVEDHYPEGEHQLQTIIIIFGDDCIIFWRREIMWLHVRCSVMSHAKLYLIGLAFYMYNKS